MKQLTPDSQPVDLDAASAALDASIARLARYAQTRPHSARAVQRWHVRKIEDLYGRLDKALSNRALNRGRGAY